MTLTGLERELENLARQYDAPSPISARPPIGERIEVLSKGERFSLIEPPTEPDRAGPAQPRADRQRRRRRRRRRCGLGFIMLLELLNRSIRRPVEIAERLGAQPFATIPYIRTRREQRWKRSVILATLIVIVVGIPLALLAVHTLYMPLDSLLIGHRRAARRPD